MLKRAELRGDLKSDTVLVEPTSGNTGIGLALLGRAMGLRVVLTMPESMSVERRTILSSFGAVTYPYLPTKGRDAGVCKCRLRVSLKGEKRTYAGPVFKRRQSMGTRDDYRS